MRARILLALVMLVGALSERGSAQESDTAPFPVAEPESVGLSVEKLGRLVEQMETWLDGGMIVSAEILPVFGHNGSDGTMSFVDPLRDVIVCYFTQSRDTSTLTPMMVLAGEAIK